MSSQPEYDAIVIGSGNRMVSVAIPTVKIWRVKGDESSGAR